MNAKQPKKDKKIAELEKQVEELTADVQRIQADFTNYKRRAEEDHAMAASFGREATITAILPVVDNIERALGNAPKELEASDYVKGVQSVAKQLTKTLDELGVTKIQTEGQQFDADLMDAVHVDGEGDEELVEEELQSGYKIGERVIRHAKVRVKRK